MFDSHFQSAITQRPVAPKPITPKQNKPLISVFKNKEAVVTLENGQSVVGTITETDAHGILVEAVIEGQGDAIIYVPYKSILIVYYTKDN